MKALSGCERREVMRSVNRGQRVRDQRLAAAAVSYSQYLQTLGDWGRSPPQVVFSWLGILFWAVMGAGAVINERYKHPAQRLVAAGEEVVDVSTRRAALVRVFGEGNGRKNDDVDAHSIALAALHTPDLPVVHPDDRAVTLRW